MIPTIWHSDRCQICEHVVSARSSEALQAGIKEHVDFVNATKDKDADAHFEADRLNRLVDA